MLSSLTNYILRSCVLICLPTTGKQETSQAEREAPSPQPQEEQGANPTPTQGSYADLFACLITAPSL